MIEAPDAVVLDRAETSVEEVEDIALLDSAATAELDPVAEAAAEAEMMLSEVCVTSTDRVLVEAPAP